MRIKLLASAFALLMLAGTGAASERPSVTPQDVFDGMRAAFHAQKAAGVHARYQWEITGAHGGDWWIEVNDGKFQMGKGRIPNPNVTFLVSDHDWVAISNDQMSGTWAFITGRLKVRGDQKVARKLDEIF